MVVRFKFKGERVKVMGSKKMCNIKKGGGGGERVAKPRRNDGD